MIPRARALLSSHDEEEEKLPLLCLPSDSLAQQPLQRHHRHQWLSSLRLLFLPLLLWWVIKEIR